MRHPVVVGCCSVYSHYTMVSAGVKGKLECVCWRKSFVCKGLRHKTLPAWRKSFGINDLRHLRGKLNVFDLMVRWIFSVLVNHNDVSLMVRCTTAKLMYGLKLGCCYYAMALMVTGCDWVRHDITFVRVSLPVFPTHYGSKHNKQSMAHQLKK